MMDAMMMLIAWAVMLVVGAIGAWGLDVWQKERHPELKRRRMM